MFDRRHWMIASVGVAVLGAHALAQPVNDDCSNATAIAEGGPFNGTTAGATGTAEASCSNRTMDVWFELPATGVVYTISVTSNVNGTFSIHDGCGGPELDSTDGRSTCRPVLAGVEAPLSFNAPGGPALIRFATDAGGSFDVRVLSDAPTGGCCVDDGCNVVSEAGCTAAGGSYLGDDTTCDAEPAKEPATFGPSAPDSPIGPGAGVVTEDTIEVIGGPDVVGLVTVAVEIEHTWLSDLEIELVHVDTGETVLLMDDQCGDDIDMNVTFADAGLEMSCGTPTTGEFAPVEFLSDFNGLNGNGMWTLRVTDDTTLEGGSLVSWSLTLDALIDPCSSVACPCDSDGSGTVDVSDLLGYLALWFALDAGAEFDGVPGIAVGDLLAFLGCWFPASGGAACP